MRETFPSRKIRTVIFFVLLFLACEAAVLLTRIRRLITARKSQVFSLPRKANTSKRKLSKEPFLVTSFKHRTQLPTFRDWPNTREKPAFWKCYQIFSSATEYPIWATLDKHWKHSDFHAFLHQPTLPGVVRAVGCIAYVVNWIAAAPAWDAKPLAIAFFSQE